MQLPSLSSEAFDVDLLGHPQAWSETARAIARHHGFPANTVVPFVDGSNLVARVDAVVVKIFPGHHRDRWESERCVLPAFFAAKDRLAPIAIPELLAEGHWDHGYTYVVMRPICGENLVARWPGFDRETKRNILAEIGRVMRVAHTVDPAPAQRLKPAFADMLDATRKNAGVRHRSAKVPTWITDDLDAFVDAWLPVRLMGDPKLLLTGEYTPFNLLVTPGDDDVRLCGMLDFGDGMVGPAVYDLLGPAVFLGEGDPLLLEALFDARGLLPWPLSAAQRRGLLALLLLHRYSNLKGQLRVEGWRDAASLEALADLVFGGIRAR